MSVEISQHPTIIEGWNFYHSNQLIETSWMMVVSSFYDHWMPSYLTKHKQIGILITAPFDVSSNILASNDRRRMKFLPFESAHRDESNDGRFILLQPLDAEIFDEISTKRNFNYCAIWRFVKYLGIQWSWKDEIFTIRISSSRRVEWW